MAKPAGLVDVGGEPTSVAVAKGFALAVVNTSADFVDTSGELKVVDIATRSIVRTIELGGQPDAIAVNRTGRYAAIAIENERNEDLCVGGTLDGMEVSDDECEDGGGLLGVPGQAPAGFLVLLDTTDPRPDRWTTSTVSLTGLASKFPGDPEPEFVDINSRDVAAVTLQENNHVVLVNVRTGRIVRHFPLGEVDLDQIDTEEEDLITFSSALDDVPREPDAVTWVGPSEFATADEGDLEGGSRGFTIFLANGLRRFAAGNTMEHLVGQVRMREAEAL